ncbi:MAG: GIY-YIG nuclease family protein [Nitrospirota bacterium]|nr:GIY-YIG nuclease family protein [Nitrospirota bacterium]MDH5768158.1 GIY-YIG nuclease family protein [Nitrospirota bacterium]
MKKFYVYILCSKRNGTLYTGVTSDLDKRVYEHKNNLVKGFTQKYKVHCLAWYEIHESAESAIKKEKQIKKWKRAWKLKLIKKSNPRWDDLYERICEYPDVTISLDSCLRRNDEN